MVIGLSHSFRLFLNETIHHSSGFDTWSIGLGGLRSTTMTTMTSTISKHDFMIRDDMHRGTRAFELSDIISQLVLCKEATLRIQHGWTCGEYLGIFSDGPVALAGTVLHYYTVAVLPNLQTHVQFEREGSVRSA